MLELSDDFLIVDELCDLLKIGHNAAYTPLKTGKLKAFRNGRIWRIPKQAVIDYTYGNAEMK